MKGKSQNWEKLGRILKPNPHIWWMASFTGSSFARIIGDGPQFEVYVTGRDSKNRSHIGKIHLDIQDPTLPLSISSEPVFAPGERGAFDENGVSYPWIIEHQRCLYMYYVGWMPTVLTNFQNETGLAKAALDADKFERVSRASILPRSNLEPFGTGSCCVLKEGERWRLWYTVWLRWGSQSKDAKHYYVIRHAESNNGIDWQRTEHICINFKNESEYAIGKPSVIKLDNLYHIWYVYRGDQYRIGYADSADGIVWERKDELCGIDVSKSGWDSRAISYPHVFRYGDYLYMLYCGNEYGKEGLGLARLKLDK